MFVVVEKGWWGREWYDETLYVIKSFEQNDSDYALYNKIFMKNDE